MQRRGELYLFIALLVFPLITIGCGTGQPTPVIQTPSLVSTLGSFPEVNITQQLVPATRTSKATPAVVPTGTLPRPVTANAAPQPTSVAVEACDYPGTVREEEFSSVIAGQTLGYRIYLPPCYGQDERVYPTVYLFHGSAQTDSHWDELGVDETADELIESGTIPPLLIIMPSGGEIAQETSGGPNSFEGVILRELVPHIESNYCAWPVPQGRALAGVSRGGYWALEIAFKNPGELASVGGHSAALLDVGAGSSSDPLISVKAADLADLRIYLDIGAEDYVLSSLQPLHDLLLELGKDHVWLVNNGQHEDQYWRRHLADYLRWYTAPWSRSRMFYPSCSRESFDR